MPIKSTGSISIYRIGESIYSSIQPDTPWVPPEETPIYSDDDYPPIPTEEIDVTLQRYVDGDSGSDANDGQLVANGGTGPWQTIEHALDQLCSSTTWKWLNGMGNIYLPATNINMKSMAFRAGLVGDPIVFRADPDVGCIIDGTAGGHIQFSAQSRWLVYGFDCVNCSVVFNNQRDLTTDHFTFRNITGFMTSGGDNTGLITMDAGIDTTADWIGVFNCNVTGNGGIAGAQQGINLSRVPNYRVENNETQDVEAGLYYKHNFQTTTSGGDAHVRNNWFKVGYSTHSIRGAFNEADISNNVCEQNVYFENGGGGDAPIDNILNHNTVRGNINIDDGDNVTVINGFNTINNIIEDRYKIDQNGTSAYPNTCTSDYNLVADGVDFQGAYYPTLVGWNAASVPANQDANSIDGLPSYIGGASPLTVDGYTLASGSDGKSAASDGEDMGADTSVVGNF